MTESSEVRRQVVHVLVGAFALLLRVLTWWQAALMAVAAVLFNLLILPRVAPAVFRPGDLTAPLKSGIVIYPLAVLALILFFPERPVIAAASWGVLAAGDGFATLVGAHVRTPALPWNRMKSTGGLVAFIACGALAAVGLAAWTTNGAMSPPWWWIIAAPVAAAVVAGFAETVPIRLNDNITVPAMAALVLWSLGAVDGASIRHAVPVVLARLGPAAAANGAAAFLGWRARTVTIPGAVAGWVIGTAIFLGAGWQGWVLLITAFAAVAIATRAGFRRKAIVGIAEEREGRRGPGNAIANTGLAAWAALVALGMGHPNLATLAMVAALVTASSDTIASEVGKAWGKTTWLIVGWRRVPPGTSGAVSSEGTAAGIAASFGLAALAFALGLIPASLIPAVVLASTLASFAEGALGALFEGPGILNNDVLNFLNSAIGAALALLVATIW
ncbi:MAG TPA: DUF92 domain-containing protein [Vicinamibacterales bacterium]|nr:DUF92 domain-containing protein [Vicinamibacterales bacterium]